MPTNNLSLPGSSLAGKNAVVTGSSSGVGRAIALELAAAGANVLIHARASADKARQTAAEVQALGVASDIVMADIAETADRQRLVAAARDWHGGFDIWINNAGADVLTGDRSNWSFDQKLARLWAVDVAGTVALSRAAGAVLNENAGGVILNMGWDQAAHGMEGDSGEMFSTIKGAIMAFTRSLAKSLAPKVRVNCLAPGWIRTAWGQTAPEYWHNRAVNESLLKRWGQPEDVARTALFLASPAASFITGQVVEINGGFAGGKP